MDKHRKYNTTSKKGIKEMSQPLPLFPEVHTTVPGVIAPINAD